MDIRAMTGGIVKVAEHTGDLAVLERIRGHLGKALWLHETGSPAQELQYARELAERGVAELEHHELVPKLTTTLGWLTPSGLETAASVKMPDIIKAGLKQRIAELDVALKRPSMDATVNAAYVQLPPVIAARTAAIVDRTSDGAARRGATLTLAMESLKDAKRAWSHANAGVDVLVGAGRFGRDKKAPMSAAQRYDLGVDAILNVRMAERLVQRVAAEVVEDVSQLHPSDSIARTLNGLRGADKFMSFATEMAYFYPKRVEGDVTTLRIVASDLVDIGPAYTYAKELAPVPVLP